MNFRANAGYPQVKNDIILIILVKFLAFRTFYFLLKKW